MTANLSPWPDHAARKPCLLLLGEFSSGKSTLANLLMKQRRSPVRVTATQVPPIWYCEGEGAPVLIAEDGTETPLETDDLDRVPLGGTRAVKVFLQSDILATCDIVDMPGSSDPNMTSGIWDALLPMADAAIWCTPATQAWRQSEAAIWEEMPESLQARSLLLLTRIDKARSPAEAERVLGRVRHEVRGQFDGVYPVALLRAQNAGEDQQEWQRSGMVDVLDHLAETIEACRPAPPASERPTEPPVDLAALRRARATGGDGFAASNTVTEAAPASEPQEPAPAAEPLRLPRTAKAASADVPVEKEGSGVMPRRVVPRTGARSNRPRRSGSDGSLI